MNVQPINLSTQNSRNNQQSFKGYVDRSVVDIINAATSNSIKAIVKESNAQRKKVSPEKLEQIKDFSLDMLRQLSAFMKKFHPKTFLAVDNKQLYIENQQIMTRIGINNSGPIFSTVSKNNINISSPISKMKRIGMYKEIDKDSLAMENLLEMAKFTKCLIETVEPKTVDKQLFENFVEEISRDAKKTSLWGKFLLILNAKKADKVAPSFGEPIGWKGKLSAIRDEAIKTEEIERINEKHAKFVQKENDKIAKEILKP